MNRKDFVAGRPRNGSAGCWPLTAAELVRLLWELVGDEARRESFFVIDLGNLEDGIVGVNAVEAVFMEVEVAPSRCSGISSMMWRSDQTGRT